jgi:hypothetical protein
MSLFSWFSPARKSKREARPSVLPDSGFSRIDSTKPAHGAQHAPAAQHDPAGRTSQRKHDRLAHREQLYAVVRDAMVRAGVLTSSYKFKVLSLDPHGKQFMVMVDLAQGALNDSARMAEVEAMVAQSARAKYDILVSALYWRVSEHVAVGDPQHRMPSVSQPAALLPELPHRRAHSRPAPLETPSRPAPLGAVSPSAPSGAVSRPSAVEPLQADEVAAFRQALDAGLRGERALAAAASARPAQNYTLLTGFEDTEMAPDSDAEAQQLSGTQYGALR